MNIKKLSVILITGALLSACNTDTQEVTSSTKISQPISQDSSAPKIQADFLKPIQSPQESLQGTIKEYISFTCVHCYNASGFVHRLNVDSNNKVEPIHILNGSEIDNERFKALEAIKITNQPYELTHHLFFETIYKRSLNSKQNLMLWLNNNVTNPKEFFKAYNSELVRVKLQENIKLQKDLNIPGTPYFVINGKDTINLEKVTTWESAVNQLKAINL